MNAADFTTCAYCPRLCRHVCPVAVGTGFEAATPTAMMSVPLLYARGELSDEDARAATSLCLGCGACTVHCKVHVPVAERLEAWRAELGLAPPTHLPGPAVTSTPAPAPAPAPAPGPALPALHFVSCHEGPYTAPEQLACCGRRDGFPEREPEAAAAVARENVRRFEDRPVVCADADCAAWLARHGARIVAPADKLDAGEERNGC